MTRRRDQAMLPPFLQAVRLSNELVSTLEQTRHLVAASQSLVATHTGPLIAPPRTSPPDALCAVFDALLAAARHVADTDDQALFNLIERALLHAGAQIERHADARTGPDDHLQ